MVTPATYEDVNLILRLYELRREEKMRTARDWYQRTFRPKTVQEMGEIAGPGTTENAYMRQVVSYYEMVSSFMTSGVLNKELYFQSGTELAMCYLRIRPILAGVREMFVNPTTFQNLETIGEEFLVWYDKKHPNAKDALIARLG